MSKEEFVELNSKRGGLIAFNSFLSTSADQDLSLLFASAAPNNPTSTAVLYIIHVDLALISTPIAFLGERFSFFHSEQEYLWGMNAVFRISHIRERRNQPWEVTLTMTSSDDCQLRALTDHLRRQVGLSTGLQRLGVLMITMGEWEKAKEIYETLLQEQESPYVLHQLGFIAHRMNDLELALKYYRHTLSLFTSSPLPNESHLAALYSNIGCVLKDQGHLAEALGQFEHSLTLEQSNNQSDKRNMVDNICQSDGFNIYFFSDIALGSSIQQYRYDS